jgi:hypothetical protein
MDDVRVQMIRAAADPGSNIARMVEWLRGYQGRVITSRKHPDFACLEEFPLAKVIEAYPCGYFNSTAAYAIAYAIHKGAKKITVFGMDFTYPDAHEAEKGRACVEFWLGSRTRAGSSFPSRRPPRSWTACIRRSAWSASTATTAWSST